MDRGAKESDAAERLSRKLLDTFTSLVIIKDNNESLRL